MTQLSPFVTFLKDNAHVQTVVSAQFRPLFTANGVKLSQLLPPGLTADSMSQTRCAKQLLVGLYRPAPSDASGRHCASCCSSCWRNPGLVEHFHRHVLPPYMASLAAAEPRCPPVRPIYAGCYRYGNLPANTAHAVRTMRPPQKVLVPRPGHPGLIKVVYLKVHSWHGEKVVERGGHPMPLTADRCNQTAAVAGAPYFGLEFPAGSLQQGHTECTLLKGLPAGAFKVADENCQDRINAHGEALGGFGVVAVYAVSAQAECRRLRPADAAPAVPAIVYVSRPESRTAKTHARSVTNQKAVFDAMLEQMRKHGANTHMELVWLEPELYREQRTLAYQARLFQRAVVVVGAHGGGLANIIFGQRNCSVTVIEFVGDAETDTYAETHEKLMPDVYKSIHYAYQGMGVNYQLGVYDKVVGKMHSDGSQMNKTSIPLADLNLHLEQALGRLD